jgi:hypothetical protein
MANSVPPHDAHPVAEEFRQPARPTADRLIIGKLLEHGRARHEFHSKGHPSYYVKLLTNDGPRTVWSLGLEVAFAKSKTQPQPGDHVGIRENNLDPVTVVHRKRDREGNVIAEKSLDTPRPHWIVEKLAFFNERIAAARALRDTTLSRREAILNHRELLGAYWALDTGQKVAEEKIKSPEGRARFMSLLRETLATTIERGEPLPAPPASRGGEHVKTPAARGAEGSTKSRTRE